MKSNLRSDADRRFSAAAFFFSLSCFILLRGSVIAQADDRATCNRIFSYAFEHKLIDVPMGDCLVQIARRFLGSPYEAGTLDAGKEESLVVDLHSFDCVTLVENVLALGRCIKRNRLTFDAYEVELRTIRYRDGRLDGYASRLHYFSDWIADNQNKGILKDVTEDIGGLPNRKPIRFMTAHRNSYPYLSADSVYQRMRMVEDSLSRREFCFIPKSAIENSTSKIHPGDIIALTTSREGLDISHVGFAVREKDGLLHFLHAPDVNGNVVISTETLTAHVKKIRSVTGIMVVRAAEPND